MKLIIDSREGDLAKYLLKQGTEFEIRSLPIGDVCIQDDDGAIIMLFERKTITDMLSSISDGRYEEQSFRLEQSGLQKNNIYYIIEGNVDTYVGAGAGLYSKSTIHSCMFSLSYVKEFSLLSTNSLSHTGDIIIKFFGKLITNSTIVKKQTNSTYIDSVKLTKKGNVTDEMVNVMMLAQIPKVSKKSAETIMGKYNYSLPTLVYALKADNNCLNDISYEIANNKCRKLNKPCISNILKYLYILEENETVT